MNKLWLAGGAIVLIAGVGAWQGYEMWQAARVSADRPEAIASPDPALLYAKSNIDTVDVPTDVDPMAGSTPMAERVAVIGLLNKRNGVSRDLTLKPGQAIRVGEVIVRLRACEETAPWEQEHYTGAFVQLDVQQPDKTWRRAFSGWLFKERPSLNVVQHPIYDVWTKSCKMSFPTGGSDSVAAPGTDAGGRSSAKKSAPVAAPSGEPTTPAAVTPSNASPSNPA